MHRLENRLIWAALAWMIFSWMALAWESWAGSPARLGDPFGFAIYVGCHTGAWTLGGVGFILSLAGRRWPEPAVTSWGARGRSTEAPTELVRSTTLTMCRPQEFDAGHVAAVVKENLTTAAAGELPCGQLVSNAYKFARKPYAKRTAPSNANNVAAIISRR